MTNRAQEVRQNRKMMLKQETYDVAEKIFNWILYHMDEDTKKKDFKDCILYLFDNEWNLRPSESDVNDGYRLGDFLNRHERAELLEVLKDVIEREEGFTADFKRTEVWNSTGFMLRVVIK